MGKLAPESKPLWILIKQEMTGWQWQQLDHMQIICTALQTDNPRQYLTTQFLHAVCSVVVNVLLQAK